MSPNNKAKPPRMKATGNPENNSTARVTNMTIGR